MVECFATLLDIRRCEPIQADDLVLLPDALNIVQRNVTRLMGGHAMDSTLIGWSDSDMEFMTAFLALPVYAGEKIEPDADILCLIVQEITPEYAAGLVALWSALNHAFLILKPGSELRDLPRALKMLRSNLESIIGVGDTTSQEITHQWGVNAGWMAQFMACNAMVCR